MIALEQLQEFPHAVRLKKRWVMIGQVKRDNELFIIHENERFQISTDAVDLVKCLSWSYDDWRRFFSQYFVRWNIFYQFHNICDKNEKLYVKGFGEGFFKSKKFGGRPERCSILFSGYAD